MVADGFKPQGYTASKHLPGSAADRYKAKIRSKTSSPHISYLNHDLDFFLLHGRKERTEKENKVAGRAKGTSMDHKYLLTFNVACLMQVI